MSRIKETTLAQLQRAIGPTRLLMSKWGRALRTVRRLLDRRDQVRRIQQLSGPEAVPVVPTRWQIACAAHEMLTCFIIPSNAEFYRHYRGKNGPWLQLLRFLDDPPTMLDPIGLSISKRELIAHLLHVVHCSAGYDVALLRMFPDGLEDLETQLGKLMAGTHPRQKAIMSTVEREDWPQLLLAALRRYRANPEVEWEVMTFEAPGDCQPLLREGLEKYGSPGRLLRYASTLPKTPGESVQLWWESLTLLT